MLISAWLKLKIVLFILISTLVVITLSRPTLASINNEVDVKTNGGHSSIDVKINNKINTGENVNTISSADSKTNVEIHQTGEGISEVNINGKQWKLNGPGNISVSEDSSASPNPSFPAPSSSPHTTPTSSPNASPTEIPKQVAEQIKNQFEEFISQLQNLIDHLKDLL